VLEGAVILRAIPLAISAVNTGLSLFTGAQQNKAQQQDYRNQRSYQEATNKFAQWQAQLNYKFQNANSQQQYWQATLQHNQQLAYVHQLQNYELAKQSVQADLVANTRAAAGAEFVGNSEAMAAQFQEAAMQDLVAQQQYHWRALQARSSVQAMDQQGQSVDRLINNYAKQAGDYDSIAAINRGLQNRQYTRQQAASIGRYLSEWNSQSFYEPTSYIEPMAPFVPLPALMMPSAPSMTGAAPGGSAQWVQAGTSLLGGIGSYMQSQQGMRQAAQAGLGEAAGAY
jgi:hypothetical protein